MPKDQPETDASLPAKRVRGQPAHAPTKLDRDTVKVMVAGGITQADIARSRGISLPTLRKHYRAELDNGATELNTMVIVEHVKLIKNGDFAAISGGNKSGWDGMGARATIPAGSLKRQCAWWWSSSAMPRPPRRPSTTSRGQTIAAARRSASMCSWLANSTAPLCPALASVTWPPTLYIGIGARSAAVVPFINAVPPSSSMPAASSSSELPPDV